MTERRSPTTEKVAAMIAAGGGTTYKAGTVTTDASGLQTITFNTAFADTNYSIQISCDSISVDSGIMAVWGNKATTGFDIKTLDDGGKAEPSVIVNWLAIAYNDP